jgi:hypothetical protein
MKPWPIPLKESCCNGERRNKKKRLESEQKKKELNVCYKRRTLEQSCSKAPTNHKKHLKKRKRMELERVESLEELSLVMIVRFKIEMA